MKKDWSSSLRDWLERLWQGRLGPEKPVDAAPPPPWLPNEALLAERVVSPPAYSILLALRPVEGDRFIMGMADPADLANYRQALRERLKASGLAQQLAGGADLLPDIAEALPEPWASLARWNRPRDIRALARHIRKNLNWYLDPSKPLKPGLPGYVGTALAIVLSSLAVHYAADSLLLGLGIALCIFAFFVAAARAVDRESLRRVFKSAFSGARLVVLGLVAVLGLTSSANLLAALAYCLIYLIVVICFSVLGDFQRDELDMEQVWPRSPSSDAERVNAEELYLYLYSEYGAAEEEQTPSLVQREQRERERVRRALARADVFNAELETESGATRGRPRPKSKRRD